MNATPLTLTVFVILECNGKFVLLLVLLQLYIYYHYHYYYRRALGGKTTHFETQTHTFLTLSSLKCSENAVETLSTFRNNIFFKWHRNVYTIRKSSLVPTVLFLRAQRTIVLTSRTKKCWQHADAQPWVYRNTPPMLRSVQKKIPP